MSVSELVSREPVPELPKPRERVRLRKRFGVTQAQLAGALKVTRQTVISWEAGDSEPAGERRQEYAAILSAWAATEQQQTGGK